MGLLSWSVTIMVVYLVVKSGGQSYNGGCGVPVCGNNCTNVKVGLMRSLSEVYLDRELFVNFCTLTDLSLQFDNICFTFIPTIDYKNTYIAYVSIVFSNGTNQVQSFLIGQDTPGIFNIVSPGCSTFTDTVIGTDQCGTIIKYRCYPCQGCPDRDEIDLAPIYGVNRNYQQMTPSCFQQAVQVIQANMVPPQRFVRLPMRLPSRCVTSQPCSIYSASGSSQCTS